MHTYTHLVPVTNGIQRRALVHDLAIPVACVSLIISGQEKIPAYMDPLPLTFYQGWSPMNIPLVIKSSIISSAMILY